MAEGRTAGQTVRDIWRKRGNANLHYLWSKEFLEAGKKQLLGDTQLEA